MTWRRALWTNEKDVNLSATVMWYVDLSPTEVFSAISEVSIYIMAARLAELIV